MKQGMGLRRPSALVVFVASALFWMVALTLVWSKLSSWTSYPVAALSQVALERAAPMWVRHVTHRPGSMEVETAVAMPVPDASGRRADIVVEVDPGRYAYGLPIFLALLLAARGSGRIWRAVAGYLLLLPAQAFSLCMFAMIQVVVYAQTNARLLDVAQWQLEAVVYGYQIGSLVVPTLVPIILWLWLDRRFFREVVVRGWQKQPAVGIAPAVNAGRLGSEVLTTNAHAGAGANAVDGSGPLAQGAGATSSPAVPPARPAAATSGRRATGEVTSSASAALPTRR